jgi:hypothetical protein
MGEDGVDLARDGAVDLEAWPDKYQFRTLPQRRRRRHGRAHAECASFVARCGHHTSLGTVTYRDGSPAELWVVALLDRRVERVHVDMDDLARWHPVIISRGTNR